MWREVCLLPLIYTSPPASPSDTNVAVECRGAQGDENDYKIWTNFPPGPCALRKTLCKKLADKPSPGENVGPRFVESQLRFLRFFREPSHARPPPTENCVSRSKPFLKISKVQLTLLLWQKARARRTWNICRLATSSSNPPGLSSSSSKQNNS